MDGTTFGLGSLMVAAALVPISLAFDALLLVAAVVDARTRRFPNALAAAMAVLGLARAFLLGAASVDPALPCADGPAVDAAIIASFLGRLVPALALCAVLVAFELLWRHRRGSVGLGLGDVKLLFCLMPTDPLAGVAAFAIGLLLLAITCLAAKRRSLPLIPFLAATWFAIRFLGRILPL